MGQGEEGRVGNRVRDLFGFQEKRRGGGREIRVFGSVLDQGGEGEGGKL